jgi:hypothetical protein
MIGMAAIQFLSHWIDQSNLPNLPNLPNLLDFAKKNNIWAWVVAAALSH